MVNKIALGGANAVLGHIGIPLYAHRGYGPDIWLILHLSGSTSLSPSSNYKVLVNTVLEAIKLGADGVSLHINIGTKSDPEMLEMLGCVSRECREFGMPLIAMMYPRGKKITHENDPDVVNIAVRAGVELGADVVKTNYTGDINSFKTITKGVDHIPVIIAGGPKMDTVPELLQMGSDSVEAGGSGVAFGRNVFQSEAPTKLVQSISKILHENYSVGEVLKEFS